MLLISKLHYGLIFVMVLITLLDGYKFFYAQIGQWINGSFDDKEDIQALSESLLMIVLILSGRLLRTVFRLL
ncbi:Uncharacterised protein [Klebsiella michiganensis]|uniref:Uncharacterized protein n=1 Tax=Klebsiella michiganensis TaxID=1134687 RepID=A0A7H4MTN6_9ENTR|nr:Uncharacterised protein [Klebsiella michiganensis]